MIKVIGHRGAPVSALENTMRSFEIAIEQGADMIEADIQLTKDKELIVFHDNTVDRITNSKGPVKDFTLSELKKIKLTDGSSIIDLKTLAELAKKNNISLFAELKGENIASLAYELISKYLPVENFIIGSFYHKQIYDIKKKKPESNTCIIMEGYPINLRSYIEDINANYISIGFESVSDSLVKEISGSAAKLILWTINNKHDLEIAVKYNPYGIISNDPGMISKNLKDNK